jgi:PAS domain S-box-containing protein
MFHSIDPHGRLVDVSNRWLEVFGYRRAEVIGRKSTEFLSEASRRYAEDVVLPEFFKSGFCNNIPYQIVTKNGKVRDVLLSATIEKDDSGKMVRSLTVLTDVTERKRTERALRDAEEAFSKAFRATSTILVVSTLSDGKVIEVNDSYERILGYRHDEVVGHEMAHIWESPSERAGYVHLLKEHGQVRDFETRFRSKQGAVVVGLVSGELVELNGEKCLLSLINDITDRKRVAQEIEVLHTDLAARALELEIANEELQAFSYTVSHDLRKPLTAVSGYCQLALEMCGNELTGTCRGYVEEILKGAHSMNRLIETLLELSRVGHSEMNRASVDLSRLAEEIAAGLKASDPLRQASFAIAPGLVDNGDASLLRVVLDNLIGNAWKYTAQEGETRIEFGCDEVGGKRSYFVRDNGVGFEGAGAGGIFTAFQRLPGSEKFQGFGIGLSTVQRIIKRHGGRIWAEGEKGKGATFRFTVS